jgi:hypothetical protein
MYDLRNDSVPGDSLIKVKMLQTDRLSLSVCALPPCVIFGGSLIDGLAGARHCRGFSQRRASATGDKYESLSMRCTDRPHWETLYFPGTAIRFHPCCRFSRKQVVHHLLLVLQ